MSTPGEIWPMDAKGRVKNAGDRTRLTPEVRRAVRALVEAYGDRLGTALHGVYLLGPAARGRKGVVEALGVLRRDREAVSRAWLDHAAGAVRARWPGLARPELDVASWDEVSPGDDQFSPWRFRLGVSSVCVAGRDLTRTLPAQALSVSAANHWIVRARDRLADASAHAHLAAREDDAAQRARAMAHFILATGFALVMRDEGVYTEDADVQAALVALHRPERKPDLDRAADIALGAEAGPADLIALVDGLGGWLTAECDRWLDVHNPERAPILPR